jgi:DNA-binding protein HU-beta
MRIPYLCGPTEYRLPLSLKNRSTSDGSQKGRENPSHGNAETSGGGACGEHEIAKRQAESILADLVMAITKHLKKGSRLRLVGLGILQVRHRAARMGRNPATGEAIKIKASKKVAFRAAKDLKEAV